MNRKIDRSALINGLFLVGLGVLFLLDRLQIKDFGDLIRMYWPCIIILFGISHLFRRDSIWSGAWLIVIGTWLQLVRLHLFGLNFGNSWPLILIASGAGITLRALIDRGAQTPREDRSEP
jgi:cell wall-active antibiotic response 4TMS protein YvqF